MKKGLTGKMNRIYNSVNEVKLRVLMVLLLSEKTLLSSALISCFDFITVYGKEFGVSNYNLHGDNRYKYSELPSRLQVVSDSLKSLVRDGMVDVNLSDGFEYEINDRGEEYIRKFECEYSTKYMEIVEKTIKEYGNYSESELLKHIQSKATIPPIFEED